MKTVKMVAIVALLMGFSGTLAAKTKGLAGAGDPCEVLICMAGKLQGSMQPGCQPVNQRFFNIRVFTPYYNPSATARTRQGFLMTCQGSAINRATLESIIQRYGRSFQE